jgi:hypothetical protein
MQKALKDGSINLGFTEIPCAVLKDGTRLITTSGVNKALGRANVSGGKGGIDNLPPFLNVSVLKPFISKELSSSIFPIEFQMKNGAKAFGYRADTLPLICEVFLKARDLGVLSPKQLEHAATADLIMRSLARVGIVALIDEATGFQEFRDKEALQRILDKYLSSEAAKWAKTFNDSFYLSIFRLKKWNPSNELRHKPSALAHITKDLVYKRLAPGLMDALEEKNPVNADGRRKSCHHQLLTRDQGINHLKGHLFMLEKLMKSSKTWDEFMIKINDLLPYANIENINLNE